MNSTHSSDGLIKQARTVLANNDMGTWTRPTGTGLYPHQWLWDSFFIAIGQRHYDIERAMAEIRSPFRAQWSNGMLPHMIFGDAKGYHAGPEMWHSERSPHAPPHLQTSGITQPPMAAEAVVKVGALLGKQERLAWYSEMYPKLVAYHEWFYRERNPRGDGLPIIVLPWESGMDNAPPWMEVMHAYAMSVRSRLIQNASLEGLAEYFRRDTKVVPAEERMETVDLYAVYDLIKKMRRYRYDSKLILEKYPMRVVDLNVSCILIRANQCLKQIADELGKQLPYLIESAMHHAPYALENLWDIETEQYYSRDDITGELIKIPNIATFMPLYALDLPQERVNALLKHLNDPESFGPAYPVPSTPLNSPYFKATRYWQGPTWVSPNWLIIEGLLRNNRLSEAESLRNKTLEMVSKSGMIEYFSPLDATKAGTDNFSWTAALTIDLLSDHRG